jgi:hypothetical protein
MTHDQESIDQRRGISRKKFLRLGCGWIIWSATSFGLYSAGTLVFPKLEEEYLNEFQTDTLRDKVTNNQRHIAQRYHTYFDAGPLRLHEEEQGIHGQEPTLAEKHHALTWLREESAKYPPKLIINHCQSPTIRVLKGITHDDFPATGVNIINQPGGFTDHDNHRTYLNIWGGPLDWVASGDEQQHFKRRYHHELYHIADYQDGGLENGNPGWAKLNPNGADAYLRENYHTEQANLRLFQKLPHQGFIDQYGLVDEDEDQATTAGELMLDPNKAFELAQQDPVIKAKIERVMGNFNRWTGKMSSQYWTDLRDGMVDESYWG